MVTAPWDDVRSKLIVGSWSLQNAPRVLVEVLAGEVGIQISADGAVLKNKFGRIVGSGGMVVKTDPPRTSSLPPAPGPPPRIGLFEPPVALAAQQPPDDRFLVSPVYALLPDELTIEPPVQLTLHYPMPLPPAVAPTTLHVFHFDAAANRWRAIPTFVDAGAATASASIASTGSYAVGARQSPPFIVERFPPSGGTVPRDASLRVLLHDPTGLDPDGTRLTIDGVDSGARLDPFPGIIVSRLSPTTIPGRHSIGLVARSGAGLELHETWDIVVADETGGEPTLPLIGAPPAEWVAAKTELTSQVADRVRRAVPSLIVFSVAVAIVVWLVRRRRR